MAESLMKILLCGTGKAPSQWTFSNNPSVDKVYFIHGGTGFLKYHQGGSDCQLPLRKGHLYLLPSQVTYTPVHDPEDPIDHLFFNFQVVPPVVLNHHIEGQVEADSTLHHLVQACDRHLKGTSVTHQQTMQDPTLRALFEALFTTICQQHQVPRVLDERVNQVLNHVQHHYLEDLDLPALADLVFLERRQLLRIFNQTMGLSPMRFVRQYRLMVAADLLRQGVSLQTVAEQMRYENQAAFCQAFKQCHGVSPAIWVRQGFDNSSFSSI